MTYRAMCLSTFLLSACIKQSTPTVESLPKSNVEKKIEPPVIDLPCDWKVNLFHQYRVTEKRFGKDGQTLKKEIKSVIDIKTLKASPLIISWQQRIENISLGEGASPREKRQKALSETVQKKLRGVTLQIEFDKDGSPNRILNLKGVTKKAQKAISEIERAMRKQKLPKELIAQSIGMLRLNYKDPKRAEAGLLREVAPLFFLSCASLPLNVSVEYKDEMPSGLGGPPIPSVGRYLLKKTDSEKGLAVIEWSQSIDPNLGESAIQQNLNQLLNETGQYNMPRDPSMTIDIRNHGQFTMDANDGWLKEAVISRHINLFGKQRVEEKRYVRTSLSAKQ